MSLIFYYAPMSTAAITELVLEELGVPCEKVKLDISKGETKAPAFLAINPNGKVPCVVHHGTIVWESAAITMYLGETFGVERNLYPATGPLRGEAMKWVVWTNVTLGDAVARFTRNTMDWYPDDEKNAKAGEAGKLEIGACLRILDQHLEGKQFLVGDTYSVVDTHLNSFADWLRHMKLDFAAYPHVNAWGARCCERPAYKKLMSGEGQ
ncbi:MAG: glutathione S-transferase family protein [Deltaproteobacteria bacterium]|nr:glutathione S-transferase family protein [Deltaproteobacteria bacterium]